MPRLSPVVFAATKPFKKFTNYKPLGYKYKIILPPVLRGYVSNKSDKLTKAQCVEEMSVLMACWKRNDFNQQRCSPELATFQKCAVAAQAAEKAAREAAKQGKTVDTSGRNPSGQVNKMLQRFPQPAHTIKLK
ncbi:small ribosomal subunit protein mS37-like [Littorina saxatilis]|uniref:CHCH domain-containing protein n=1 Tax=Littorina saxatilis TaxID=31220 RepID=A0AAN9BSI4_9CAEN